MFALLRTKEVLGYWYWPWLPDLNRWGQGKGKMKSMDKLMLLDIALSFNTSFRLKKLKQQMQVQKHLASVKKKSMPYRTKTHPWIYLIHPLLIGKFLKYLLITQAVELICQTNSDAAVFEMHHNDFFAKTFHSGVEFYFLWRWQRTKAAKNSYYKVIDALMFGEVFDRQTCSQSVFICKDNGRCGEGTNQRSSCTMKCLIIILRFCEWFAPCILTTVKQTTKTLRILPPTFKPVSQQIRLVQVACILDSDWKKLRGSRAIRGSYVTCCKTSLPWAGKTRANCTDFLAKSRTTLYFPQPATRWFVARQIWFVGGKTSNISIVSFHMTSRRPYWCSKTMKRRPCWCLKPILWTLNFFLCKRFLLFQ